MRPHAVGTRGAANRTGMWSLVIFWAVQQLAKLNVFFGVENPAANFRPPHRAYLGQFFGPPVNSLFLVLSIAAVSVSTLVVAWRGRAAMENGDRQATVDGWRQPLSFEVQCWIAWTGLALRRAKA
ncbi:MAG: DUF3623 family protein [Gemmatimonadaceae bacterium]|nr:DUF3623 family protein [Gemmatimonadaceae bacterium]